MRIGEVDALVAHRGHGRRGLRRHRQRAQAVGNEQDEVVLAFALGGSRVQQNGGTIAART